MGLKNFSSIFHNKMSLRSVLDTQGFIFFLRLFIWKGLIAYFFMNFENQRPRMTSVLGWVTASSSTGSFFCVSDRAKQVKLNFYCIFMQTSVTTRFFSFPLASCEYNVLWKTVATAIPLRGLTPIMATRKVDLRRTSS